MRLAPEPRRPRIRGVGHPSCEAASVLVRRVLCRGGRAILRNGLGLGAAGLVEKDEYIKKIKDHFGIKDEM